MFGNPCFILLFKVCAHLKFLLYHTSDSTFCMIRLIISKVIKKVQSASEQQERNKMNYCAQNCLADEFWDQISEISFELRLETIFLLMIFAVLLRYLSSSEGKLSGLSLASA